MKNKKVLGSIVTLLLIGLFAAILTLILPLQENPADGVHDCIDVEATITRNADGHIVSIYMGIKGGIVIHGEEGDIVIHGEEGHKPHPFDCNHDH